MQIIQINGKNQLTLPYEIIQSLQMEFCDLLKQVRNLIFQPPKLICLFLSSVIKRIKGVKIFQGTVIF